MWGEKRKSKANRRVEYRTFGSRPNASNLFSGNLSGAERIGKTICSIFFGGGWFSETFPNQQELVMKECRERKRKK